MSHIQSYAPSCSTLYQRSDENTFVAHSVNRRIDDDIFSETSTIRVFSNCYANKIKCFMNSAAFVENDFYDNDNSDIESIQYNMNHHDNEYTHHEYYNSDDDYHSKVSSKQSINRISRIDTSPEAEQKRREVFSNWVKNVNAREKEKKRLEKEKIQALEKAKREQERQKKSISETKLTEWFMKKQEEAEKKIKNLELLKKKKSDESKKAKEYKRAVSYDIWIQKKNEQLKASKLQKEKEKEKKLKEQSKKNEKQQHLTDEEFKKWLKNAQNTARPVKFNQGLDSLRGASTKIYTNPIPWQSITN